MKNNHEFYCYNLNYKSFGEKFIIFIKMHMMPVMV